MMNEEQTTWPQWFSKATRPWEPFWRYDSPEAGVHFSHYHPTGTPAGDHYGNWKLDGKTPISAGPALEIINSWKPIPSLQPRRIVPEDNPEVAGLRERVEQAEKIAENISAAQDENQRAQLEALGLLGRFQPGVDLADEMGKALLTAEEDSRQQRVRIGMLMCKWIRVARAELEEKP